MLSIIAGVIGKIGASLLSLYAVAAFLPGLAASIRRLRDTNRSGWWLLIMSHAIENEYGPRPQAALA
jgi:uncharacterized membrane protein YhaH (DUF805 family)